MISKLLVAHYKSIRNAIISLIDRKKLEIDKSVCKEEEMRNKQAEKRSVLRDEIKELRGLL